MGRCGRKSPQGHMTVFHRLSHVLKKRGIKVIELPTPAWDSFFLLIRGETFGARKSCRECSFAACLMGKKTFALELK